MMLVVMDHHRLGVDVRLQRVVGVRQLRQRVVGRRRLRERRARRRQQARRGAGGRQRRGRLAQERAAVERQRLARLSSTRETWITLPMNVAGECGRSLARDSCVQFLRKRQCYRTADWQCQQRRVVTSVTTPQVCAATRARALQRRLRRRFVNSPRSRLRRIDGPNRDSPAAGRRAVTRRGVAMKSAASTLRKQEPSHATRGVRLLAVCLCGARCCVVAVLAHAARRRGRRAACWPSTSAARWSAATSRRRTTPRRIRDERIVECTLRLSVSLASGNIGDVESIRVEISDCDQRLRVFDFSPQHAAGKRAGRRHRVDARRPSRRSELGASLGGELPACIGDVVAHVTPTINAGKGDREVITENAGARARPSRSWSPAARSTRSTACSSRCGRRRRRRSKASTS